MELTTLFEGVDAEKKLRKLLTPEFMAKKHTAVANAFLRYLNESQMMRVYDELDHEENQDRVEFIFEVLSNWVKKDHPKWDVKYGVGPSSNRLDIKPPGCELYVTFTGGEFLIELEFSFSNARWKKKRVKKENQIKPVLEEMLVYAAKVLDIDLD